MIRELTSISAELEKRGESRLAHQVSVVTASVQMRNILKKHFPKADDDVIENLEDLVPDGIMAGVGNPLPLLIKAQGKPTFRQKATEENGITRDGYSYWCTVEYHRQAVTSGATSISWAKPALKEILKNVKRYGLDVEEKAIKTLLESRDILAFVEDVTRERINDFSPGIEEGKLLLDLEEKIEDEAWSSGAIDYETSAKEWDEDGNETEMIEGPDMDIRFRFEEQPIKVSNVKATSSKVTFSGQVIFAINFQQMYFPGEYNYRRN